MPDHRDALDTLPPQDEARTRWTRPMIHELSCVQVTEGGPHSGLSEDDTYRDIDAS